MRAIRYRLTTLGTTRPSDSLAVQALVRLEAAAPAYRACLWDAHDALNRQHIAALVSMLVEHAPLIQRYLSRLYRDAWPAQVAVDVAPYTDFAGANTESGPGLADHMMIASRPGSETGYGGLEILLHEASHILFGPRHGAVSRALNGTTDSLDRDLPRGLWHAVSFYTSGEAVRAYAELQGVDYVPYRLRRGLFADYEDALQMHWQPYLDGSADLDAAALALVSALSSE